MELNFPDVENVSQELALKILEAVDAGIDEFDLLENELGQTQDLITTLNFMSKPALAKYQLLETERVEGGRVTFYIIDNCDDFWNLKIRTWLVNNGYLSTKHR